jgi:3-dehydroquinate synthase
VTATARRLPPRQLQVELGARTYPIRIGSGLIADAGAWRELHDRPVRLLSDEEVARHWLKSVVAQRDIAPEHTRIVPSGEGTKTMQQVEACLDWLLETRMPRDGVLIALGGGVIGDLAGFVAAIYQRGIDFVQVPTTLLAQVDSSVGGKTGVNHALGKNLIGAFHQPRLVLADCETLSTLPARELSAGLAEVIKYGMLGDADFFAWLEDNMAKLRALDAQRVMDVIERCCTMKAQVVVADERESGRRALLNLGHTFAHAIETHTEYARYLHGEAVGIGLVMAAGLSRRLGWLSASEVERVQALVAAAGLPSTVPEDMTPADFMRHMAHDKKVVSGRLRFVLLRRLGEALVTGDVPAEQLSRLLAEYCTATDSA